MGLSSSCLINQFLALREMYGKNHLSIVTLGNAIVALVERDFTLDEVELSLREFDQDDSGFVPGC